MSSRRKSSTREGSSYYPTQWSEWQWSEEYERYYRYRLKGPDDYEWEYEKARAANEPRTIPPTGPILPLLEHTNYPFSVGYTTEPGADSAGIVQSLPQNTLGQSTTPRWQNHITGKGPQTSCEELDQHYKVHPSREFKWGRVFKVLWAEPKGAEGGRSGHSGTDSISVTKGPWGEETFAKVRRFVIISPMKGHCICLPIVTYSGQGVNKTGVHAAHHAIIYSGNKAVAFKGEKEKGLVMRSIRVYTHNPRYRMDGASRLNYAKTYTVEHNVKVWFIGKVHHDSEWQLRTDYNLVHPPLEIKGVRPPDSNSGSEVHYAEEGGYPAATGYEYADEVHFGERGDPGDDLREPGDSDNNGDQRDGDRAGGQTRF